MKKIICFLLAALMTASLCSCRISNTSDDDENNTAGSAAVQEEEEEEEDEDEGGSTSGLRGTWEDNVYTNTFAELTYECDEEWIIQSDEVVADLIGIGAEMLFDEQGEYAAAAAKLTTLYDMMVSQPRAIDDRFADNVMIMYENLTITGADRYTEEEFLEIMKQNMQKVSDYYVAFSDVKTARIGGNKYYTMAAVGETAGVSYVQEFAIRKEGKYMIEIVASADNYEGLQNIFDNFDGYREADYSDFVAQYIEESVSDTDAEIDNAAAGEGWEGSVYTDSLMGIKFNLPEGWVIDTEADEMKVESSDGLANVQVVVKDVGLELPLETYIQTLQAGLCKSYEESGLSYELSDNESVTIGGREYIAFTADVERMGIEMQQYVAVTSDGGIYANVVVTMRDGTDLESILACFE